MERGKIRSVGEVLRPFVDARVAIDAPIVMPTARARPSKTDVLRMYSQGARHLGHRASDREFHKTLIGLSKAADYAAGREVVVAHSNSFLSSKCTMAKTTFTDQLRKHDGKTIRRQLSGNGHRFVARRSSENHDGEVIYHNGISLEPMIERLLELLPALSEEAENKLAIRVAKARAGAARRRQREALSVVDDSRRDEATRLEMTSRATALPFRTACQRGDVDRAENLAAGMTETATKMEALNDVGATECVEKPTPEMSGTRHHLHLQDPIELIPVMLGGDELGDTPEQNSTQAIGEDENWKPGELRSLFPTLAIYLVPGSVTDWGSIMAAGERVVRDLGINQGCWADAGTVMGRKNRYVALGLVAELTSEGKILTTPGRYFGGMLRKARSGELDLRRSVWKLRAKSPTSSVITNSRWRRPC